MQTTFLTDTKLIEQTLVADSYRSDLEKLAINITGRCIDAPNEASVVNVFDINIFIFLRDHFNLDYFPEKEYAVNTVRSVAKGKIDSKVGALVIEYKQPSKLKTSQDKDKAISQIKEYLEGLQKTHESNYVGFITDGVNGKLVELRYGKFTEGAFTALNAFHLDTLIKSVVLLDKLALTADNLIDSFCKPTGSSLVKKIVKVFYDTLSVIPTERTTMLYQEWRELFKLAHDDASKQQAIIERSAALSDAIGTKLKNNDEEYRALYSLQTAYALIVKIIAYKVACNAKFDENFFEFNSYPSVSNELLIYVMQRLEDGAVFRQIGVGNLLEGDFFSWYSNSKQWNDEIADCVRQVFEILSRYEDIAIFGSKEGAQDLFRELYLNIMPDKVRHSLGEFYTPTWLADNVVSGAIGMLESKTGWIGLDPCAGSGTFVNVMIQKVLEETSELSDDERLSAVISRVRGIDLNPLAVLTSRVNYFINVSSLIHKDQLLEIPIYLGDASYVPELIQKRGTECYTYRIMTLKKELAITLPKSVINDASAFSRVMTDIETDIKALNSGAVFQKLMNLASREDAENDYAKSCIKSLAVDFVELERNNWDGIWARIVTNFLLTANLEKSDIVVGNPPWIDWKTLPAGYRERIKGLCVSRQLFSGDRITGGINLNICALISNVAAQKWLKQTGVMGFLMPKPLIFQQSYEGFRNLCLDDGKRMFFQEFHDWTKAGHPFQPVQQEFLTYYISHSTQDYTKGISVVNYKKLPGLKLTDYQATTKYEQVKDIFTITKSVAFQSNAEKSTAFSYAHSKEEVGMFSSISGTSDYKGREGIEFYPQELFLLKLIRDNSNGTALLENYQNQKSKHKIPPHKTILEKQMLRPLIKGVNIERFHIREPEYFVPFPYDGSDMRLPMPFTRLHATSPLLAKYLMQFKPILTAQTNYNDRIIGKGQTEFYALARVGAYSFAKNHVAFRDNTKWQAAVVTSDDSWHDISSPVFQNHAVTISERPDGAELTLEEAHYICAVMNAPAVQTYIKQSSDSRSYKIRPPIQIPLYTGSSLQRSLSELSTMAHSCYSDHKTMRDIDKQLDILYLEMITK